MFTSKTHIRIPVCKHCVAHDHCWFQKDSVAFKEHAVHEISTLKDAHNHGVRSQAGIASTPALKGDKQRQINRRFL